MKQITCKTQRLRIPHVEICSITQMLNIALPKKRLSILLKMLLLQRVDAWREISAAMVQQMTVALTFNIVDLSTFCKNFLTNHSLFSDCCILYETWWGQTAGEILL